MNHPLSPEERQRIAVNIRDLRMTRPDTSDPAYQAFLQDGGMPYEQMQAELAAAETHMVAALADDIEIKRKLHAMGLDIPPRNGETTRQPSYA